ncbi:MAG: F0F1 ATP synthase subunit A [Breznakibacter sp.]
MKFVRLRAITLFILIFLTSPGLMQAKATEATHPENQEIEVDAIINHHISDSHKWVIFSYPDKEEHLKEIALHLPIILFHQGSFLFSCSSEFEHEKIVEKDGVHYVMHHDKIFVTDEAGTISDDGQGNISNLRPLDLSITRNVASMLLSVTLLLGIFISIAKKYHKREKPAGMQSAMEAIIIFINKDIVESQIGKNGARYAPFLLTLFFFIWINNMIGLFPFFPGSSNLSGNIAFTGILALFTFIVTTFSGNKSYWRHIFVVPGVPAVLKIILVPIEIISMFTKPFTLLIRLFANVTGGHIILISLISMIFIAKSYVMAPISILLSLLIFMLEIIFGLLQAYIFTLLSALYIGLATHEEEH